MKKGSLMIIFFRSFFIHATLNYRRMQNIGFAYAMIPLLRERNLNEKEEKDLLSRHLQMFNTQPYLSTPLIGSILKLEEERPEGGDASSIMMVKHSLMGPYAAIGDTFFWGALRPCAGIFAVAAAGLGWILAPLAFVFVYLPAVFWVRARGFLDGYRRGKQGIEFVRKMNLPQMAVRVQWLSLAILAAFGVLILPMDYEVFKTVSHVPVAAASLILILVCWRLMKKGVSQIYLLYGAAVLFLLITLLKELLLCWK